MCVRVCVCVCGKSKTISNWNFGIGKHNTHTHAFKHSVYGVMQKDVEHRHDCVFAFVFSGWIVITIQKHIRPIDNDECDDDEFHPRYQNTNPNASNLFCWCLILYQNVLNAYCVYVCASDCDMRFLVGQKNVDT